MNVLPITGHLLPDGDYDAPAKAAGRNELAFAGDEFYSAAKAAADAGRADEAKVHESLAILCFFAPNFDSISEPYQPRIRSGGQRSPTPDDLTDADLITVGQLRAKISAPLLRARLGDILWVRKRDHVAAKEASADYIAVGKAALTQEDWVFSPTCFQRALQLAHRLGRKNEAWINAEAAAVAALSSPVTQTEPFFASHFMRVLEEMSAGDPRALAVEAKIHADKAAAENDARRSRDYCYHAAGFWALAKEQEKENAARIAAAMTYEAEAEQFLKRNPPSYLGASGALAKGTEALRQARGDPAVIDRLKARLLQYQKESLKEMQSHPFEFDLSTAAQKAAEIVDHPDFREALKLLVFARPLTSPEKVRATVLKQAEDFPISHLFGGSVVDHAGRVTGHIDPLVGSQANESQGIEARMFRHVAQFDWQFRAVGYIEPARQKIWQQHTPAQGALDFLVKDNPFVPPGHQGIYRRGLYYGLCGDMLLAAHLLAPQLENSIRYVLEQNGVDVSNLESDLTQPVKTLGPLLTLPATTEIFGPDGVFELRGLLIEKLGYSFRHRVAHGFVSEGECYGPECSNLWWLALRLCYTPLMPRMNPGTDTKTNS